MLESLRSQRRIGRFAWVMAWVGLVVGQVHALARFATQDGNEDLELPLTASWAEPAADLLRPLLGWAHPDIVYVTYGKIWFLAFLAFTLCALVVYRRRQPAGFEKWAWRVAIASYVLASLAVFLEYWTQWTGTYNGDGIEGALFTLAWFVTVPSFLMVLVSSTVLGITMLVRRFRPTLPSVLLALLIPLALAILQFTSMGSAALPVMFAFGILGRRIARAESTTPERRATVDVSSRPALGRPPSSVRHSAPR
jgi:hypothetical protein